MTAPHISLNQQALAVLEAGRTQARADHTEHRRGKMRLSAVEYRQSMLAAAADTLNRLDWARDRVKLAPAEIDLFKEWQQTAKEHAAVEADMLIGVSAVEYIAVAKLLRTLARLALRDDLVA